ncbi:restriction endonuclease subunit S [Vibrio cortegadensis]|uniref:restriction endonuclease subunit S n=1 Tax=Vibrio cortegadensis TaxID=1328770 RepID=UPI0021C46D7C|nr:restriction endonuclease subunit S [Vibrio cortegadensis]MDN3696181.1 restriction endonuclease subunit S [Vibrio cortegadensis]
MSELPKGWVDSRLEESIYLNQKFTNIDDDSECGFVPMAMVPTKYGAPIEFEMRTWGKCKKGYTQFQNDDILLAKITPCFENGKGALVSGLPNGIGAGSTEYFVLRSVSNLVEPKYLHAFVKTRDFLINCETNMSGSVGHRRVPKDYLLNYSMPLAPLAEQKRIVEKLDEVLVQVDTIKARLDGIPDLLKRFRQSVLASAVSGKLTEEWREGNGEQDVWDANFDVKLLTEHVEPYVLPESWSWDNLGNLVAVLNSKRKPIKQADRNKRQGEYPYYGAFGIIDHIDDYVFDGEYILLAEDGKNLEQRSRPIALVANGKYWVNNHAHVLEVKPQIDIKYLCYFLNSPHLVIDEFLTGQDQVKLNKVAMVKLPIPVPSYTEQKEIVRLVDQYFAFADTIEAQVKKAQARVDNLTQSILAKAFRGELVAQDPKDEPADKLLERIAEARKEAEALAKAAKKAEATKKRAAKKST